MTADAWGIDSGYEDALGNWRDTSEASRKAVLEAMGVDPFHPAPPPQPLVRVMRPGETLSFHRGGDLRLEDGTELSFEKQLPPDLPFGYHSLLPHGAKSPLRLIASPGKCFLPESLKIWGWAVQLYSLRSSKSWGMGDFADLRSMARWSRRDLGAGTLLINPIGAAGPGTPQNPSPYFPSSRRFRNPLYLRIDDIPGAAEAGRDMEEMRRQGKDLNQKELIDRDSIWALKMRALELLFSRFPGDPAFEKYCAEEGEALRQFGVFCSLGERHGNSWRRWPRGLRHPASAAVTRFAKEAEERVRFHKWVQWLLDRQVAAAARELPAIQDLPIGFDPGGADAWVWQDLLGRDTTVGVPPDEFNTLGQDWGLPPFTPHKLAEAGYEPIRQTIRAALRHGGGLRIDHVMGLFRLYWIPRGLDPSGGAFVRYSAEDLLAVVALESHRAKALVVGEDLGTVEASMREQLSRHRVLSYRLVWFEKKAPAAFPRLAMAAVTTHDLPTIAGLWSGHDLKKQKELRLNPNEKGTLEIRHRLAKMTGLSPLAPLDEVIARTHRLLANSPSMILTATLEDALGVLERPNVPNTTTERPNWSIPLPASLESIKKHPLVRKVAGFFRGRAAFPARKSRGLSSARGKSP